MLQPSSKNIISTLTINLNLQQANGSADSAGLRHTRPEAQGGFMSVQDLIVRMQLKHVIRIVYDKSSLLPQLLTRM